MQIPVWVKPAFWGIVVGVLGWWAVLFWGLGWMSGSAATAMAQQKAETAVVASVTPYCVHRFEQQTDPAAAWKKLKTSADNFNQDSFLVKGGWTALPGAKLDPSYADAIADSCSTRLLALKTIGGVKVSSAN
jgi:hypothetical protein